MTCKPHKAQARDAEYVTGARTDAVDARGRTALHLAVGCSCKMVEKLLPLAHAALDAADVEGRMPLHYAAEKGVWTALLQSHSAGKNQTFCRTANAPMGDCLD